MAAAILAAARESASDPMPINRPAEQVREIALSLIDPPAFNPRRNFDQAELEQLAASFADGSAGQLQPVIVRKRGKRFQIVAGERRYRAAGLAKLKTLTCTVRELDDKQAAEVQLCENVHRKDLDPLEIATGLRLLGDMGHTVETLAELIGADPRDVGSRLGLLSLPDDWQSRIRTGEITAAQAEYLIPWSGRPQVLAAMAGQPAKELPLSEWKHRILAAVTTLSRSMDPQAPDGPIFVLAPDTVRRLDVVTIEPRAGKMISRAMNAGLWDELQERAQEAAQVAPAAERTNGHPGGHAAKNGSPASRAKSSLATAGGASAGARYGSSVVVGEAARMRERRKQLDAFKAAWLRKLCHDAIDAAAGGRLPALAEALGVDLAGRWRLRRDFLELFAGDELDSLAAELNVPLPECRDDGERRAVLLNSGARAMPTAVREALGPSCDRD